MINTLEIDGVRVPTEAVLEFEQEYTDLAGVSFERLADGAGVVRSTWSGKLATRLRGEGWAPSALENLALGTTHVMRCIMPRQVAGAGLSITLPAARRSDAGHEPIGLAAVGDALIETPITNLADILSGASDAATLTAVAGADGYRVQYWPEITAVITSNTSRGRSRAVYDWALEAEQV